MTISRNVPTSRAGLRVGAILMVLAVSCGGKKSEVKEEEPAAKTTTANVARFTPASAHAAGILVEQVGTSTLTSSARFTGAVEADQQQLQQVTPLVAGRVEQVYARLGDPVRAGGVLATISSPEVAEMHGKLLEAQAHLNLTEATLRRTRRLTELGAAAGKDLAAATAESETARFDVHHRRDALRILGALPEDGQHNISSVRLVSPIGGVVTERMVNPGSGVEAGKPLFTIVNLSTVWVIANVPEAQLATMRLGAPANVHAAALGAEGRRGVVAYVDPVVSDTTRTARVRIDVRNPGGRLKVGMFVEVTITNTTAASQALTVPEEAVQRVNDKDVVFVQTGANAFARRDVTLGDRIDGRRIVLAGLVADERVVTKGSFTVKSQMLKSEFAEGD
jgi:cobalt-zinc-cadmium efflux system membrane fusion protein